MIGRQLLRRRWLLPVGVLVVDAILLFGAVVLGLRLPGQKSVAALPRSTAPDYANVHGAVQPLRPGFVAAALGEPNTASAPRDNTGAGGEGSDGLTTLLRPPAGQPGDVPVVSVGNNDDFARAARVAALPWAGRANTTGSTRQAKEPGSCAPVGGTVWFRYDAPAVERLRASVSSGTSTALAAYEGQTLSDLQQIGCSVSATGNPSLIFEAAAGHTYFFQVDRPAGGPLVFHLEPQASIAIASLTTQGQVACSDLQQKVADVPPDECGKLGSRFVSMSADGRWVAFASDMPLVVTRLHATCSGGDCTDVYVRDVKRGRTILASVSSSGVVGNDSSTIGWGPYGISADGRYVTFTSLASNLVPHDTNQCDDIVQHMRAGTEQSCADIFVHDVRTGRTQRVSVSSRGEQANGASYAPSISPDGRYVAFVSFATNLVPHTPSTHCLTAAYYSDTTSPGPPPTEPCPGVYLHDLRTGRTERIDVTPTGAPGTSSSTSDPSTAPTAPLYIRIAISRGGRYVAFVDHADNLVAHDTNGMADVFVRDRLRHRTTLVSLDEHGAQFPYSYAPALTADGRYVTFTAEPPTNPGTACTWYFTNVTACPRTFLRDLRRGITRPVDVAVNGGPPNDYGGWAMPTADGRYVVFWSAANNLTDVDTNSPTDLQCAQGIPLYSEPGLACTPSDVFIRDMTRRAGSPGAITQVSLTPTGQQPAGNSWLAVFSPDGRYVAFESWAPIIARDTNTTGDIYLYDRGAPLRVTGVTSGRRSL